MLTDLYITLIGIVLIIIGWIFLWARHIYLVSYKLNRYMTKHYKKEWEAMKGIIEWYQRGWGPYYSKAVYDFIWRTNEDFGDENVRILRQKIKRIIWEFAVYVLIVICFFIGIILNGMYK